MVLEKYPKAQFIIAGDGVLRPECESLIQELNLTGKFFLLGYRNDIDRIYPILTLTALSSLWEGLPVVFQESMIAGKPIIANDVDGACDVIINGKTGFLVTPHQPQEMADRILTLLNHEELCNQMGMTAKQHAQEYSNENMIQQIISLYVELLEAHYDGDLSRA